MSNNLKIRVHESLKAEVSTCNMIFKTDTVLLSSSKTNRAELSKKLRKPAWASSAPSTK